MCDLPVRIVLLSAAAACGILLVGGAIQKVANDQPDECIAGGLQLGLAVVEPTRPDYLDKAAAAILNLLADGVARRLT